MSSIRMLCWHHKYGPRLYLADTDERLHAAAVAIVSEGVDEGLYAAVDNEEETKAKAVLALPPPEVWTWLQGRRRYEYECTELMQAKDPLESEATNVWTE